MKSLEPQTVKALYSVVLQYYRVVISFSALFARFQILCRQLILACYQPLKLLQMELKYLLNLNLTLNFKMLKLSLKYSND